MRILTTDIQYRVRQGAGALAAAVAVTFGLCAAPAQAHEFSRSPLMHVAMLTGSMVPTSFSTTLPAMRVSDADAAMVAPISDLMPVAARTTVDDASAAPSTSEATPDVASNQDIGVTGVPLAAARIDDEQLGSQRGRNLQGGAMVQSPGMVLANGVTLWDELPGAVTPMPRPQQLSSGVNNVQVTRVTYSTR